MPTAGLEAGISGKTRGVDASAVVVVVGASAGFVAASVGASVEDACAEAAFGGAGTVAPAGSGAEIMIR
jgi:hypothetical protein